MLALRYVYVLALVAWLGGLLSAGTLVAPAVFSVLQAQDPVGGRATAGLVFGNVLARLHLVGYAAGGIMIVLLTILRLLGPRPDAYGIRVGIITTMLLLTTYADVGVLRRATAVQREAGGSITALAPADARRITFDGLHRQSTWLMGLIVAGGLALAAWETRE